MAKVLIQILPLALLATGMRGEGEIWNQAIQYYREARKDSILFRLHYRFDKRPLNWNNPPVNTDRYNIIMH